MIKVQKILDKVSILSAFSLLSTGENDTIFKINRLVHVI